MHVCVCVCAIPARDAQISRRLKTHTREKVSDGTGGFNSVCVAACISVTQKSDTQTQKGKVISRRISHLLAS